VAGSVVPDLPGYLPVDLGVRTHTALAVVTSDLAGAVVLGAATHVLWDEFTHPRRWGPEHIPALSEQYGGVPLYTWLQDLSGLAGALAIAVWVLLWWRRTPPRPVSAGVPRSWLLVAAIAVVSGVVGGAGQPDTRSALVLGAFAGGTAIVVAVLVLAVGWHVRARRGVRT
jgi:hypothetical protein